MCFQPELPWRDKEAGDTELTFSKHSFVSLGQIQKQLKNQRKKRKTEKKKGGGRAGGMKKPTSMSLSDVDPHIRLLTVPSQIVNDSDKFNGLAAVTKGPSEDSFILWKRNYLGILNLSSFLMQTPAKARMLVACWCMAPGLQPTPEGKVLC